MQNKQHSPVMLRIKQNAEGSKKIFIIMCIIQLLGLPMISLISQIFYSSASPDTPTGYMTDNLKMYLMVSTIVLSLSGIIFALRSFSYLYKQSQTDMNLALPLTSSQRFLCDFFSGLAVYIIPYLISAVLSLILLGTFHLVSPDIHNGVFENIPLLKCIFSVLLVMIMFYTMTSLITICCGRLFEAVLFTFLINIMIPVFMFLLGFIIFYDKVLRADIPFAMINFVMAGSPVGGMIKAAGYFTNMDIFKSFMNIFTILRTEDSFWFIRYSSVIIILFLASFFLYKKRKAEDVSKPFVFSFIYYLFIMLLTISISGILFRLEKFIMGIVISAVIFFIIEIITIRKPRHILKSVVSYAVTLTISFLIVKSSSLTDGFGLINKVPEASKVRAATMSFSGFYTEGSANTEFIEFTDPEDIEKITTYQREYINFNKEFSRSQLFNQRDNSSVEYSCELNLRNVTSPLNLVEIAYQMKNGDVFYRSYFVPYNIWTKNIVPLSSTKAYKEYLVNNLEDKYICNGNTSANMSINIKSPVSTNGQQLNLENNSDFMCELMSAYKKDIMAQTENDIPDFRTCCIINNHIIGYDFTNTLELLKKNNIEIPKVSDNTTRIFIADSDYVIEHNKLQTNTITARCGTPFQYYSDKYDSDLIIKLLKVAQPNYYTDEHCYFISLGSDYHFNIIPSEYSELAEEFMKKSELQKISWDEYDSETFYNDIINANAQAS